MGLPAWHEILPTLYRWQELVSGILAFSAGILGFLAAIYAVRTTLLGEKRRIDRQLAAIRLALAAEVIYYSNIALSAHDIIKTSPKDGVSLERLAELTNFSEPVIYRNIANQIGLLEQQTGKIVLFFSKLEVLRAEAIRIRQQQYEQLSGMEQLMGRPAALTPSAVKIGPKSSDRLGDMLLTIAEIGADLLPSLTLGTREDEPAFELRRSVKQARVSWGPDRAGVSNET
jgi:hypothetical protein